MKKAKLPEKLLTPTELEIMAVIWDGSPCTVRDVLERLPANRDLAYTSVATIMKILEQKRFLASERSNRTHLYEPVVARKEYESASLHHLKQKLFRGDASSLVMRLLGDGKVTEDELTSIRTWLDERLEEKR